MINYTDNEQALIFMSCLEFFTSKIFEKVCQQLSHPKDIFDENFDAQILKPILKSNFLAFESALGNFNKKTFFEALNKRGIKCLTILSQNYPQRLSRLNDPPYVLFMVGNEQLLNSNTVAMVGARNPSTYGKLVTQKFAKSLAQNAVTIVSGLASGVDKLAHEGALAVNGNTIAVLAGGFDHMFPAMNINLAREIAQKGLIITEHFVTHKPTKYSFPTRNRIIAALSDAILITEAGKKSGSLYTSEFGTEMGIDTYCVPGNITNELSYSTNDLIKKGAAACVTSPDDILCLFGITKSEAKKQNVMQMQLSFEETAICNLLKDGEKDFIFLQEKTGFSTQNLNIGLTSLEIRGIIKKLVGNVYVLCE
ncbi:MAG: DNA-processing protein DprA [Clostridia bacterium]|nr:DNA-processing protein DprA [Clostridia bacterium]